MNVTITNPTVQLFHLPRRGGETVRRMLPPGGRLEVPFTYVEALLEECKTKRRMRRDENGKMVPLFERDGSPARDAVLDPKGRPVLTGWALRLERVSATEYRVRGPKGAMSVFEARILAHRKARYEAEEKAREQSESAAAATERALRAESQLSALMQRVEQLEAAATRPDPKADAKSPPKVDDAAKSEPTKADVGDTKIDPPKADKPRK